MNYTEEFEQLADSYFNECADGLKRLEKILVSVADDELTDWCRAFFIPAAYSYWERFFKLTFEEFLNSINKARFELHEIDIRVVAKIKRRELKKQLEKIDLIKDNNNNYCQSMMSCDADSLFLASCSLIPDIFQIKRPGEFIDTHSNVKFNVIEDNFKKFNLSFSDIISVFRVDNVNIKELLEEFVGIRNAIGHGSELKVIENEDWSRFIEMLYKLMDSFQNVLSEALRGAGGHNLFSKNSSNPNNDICDYSVPI